MIFKREKELARKLEFDGLYITEQPEDDDVKGQWNRLVLNTPYGPSLHLGVGGRRRAGLPLQSGPGPQKTSVPITAGPDSFSPSLGLCLLNIATVPVH